MVWGASAPDLSSTEIIMTYAMIESSRRRYLLQILYATHPDGRSLQEISSHMGCGIIPHGLPAIVKKEAQEGRLGRLKGTDKFVLTRPGLEDQLEFERVLSKRCEIPIRHPGYLAYAK